MSLEVGRVGVRPDQLDNYGRINPKSQFIQNLLNDLPVWTDLPVWKSGTEQLLPVNDDEPDTSPILCDIEYPVADLKNNQYFTYRQSPTQKDGKAKIRGIRGKTLVWNQQIPVRTTNDTVAGVTVTSNKDGSYSISGTATSTNANYWFDTGTNAGKYTSVTGHKLFIQDVLIVQSSGLVGKQEASFGQSKIITSNFDGATRFRMPAFVNGDEYSSLKVVPMCIDLTLMFGAGNEPTTVKEFTDLFPLPYYKYNAGSLLNFAGTKVKTVGFNQASSFKNGADSTQYLNALYVKADLQPDTDYCISYVAKNGHKFQRNEYIFTNATTIYTGNGKRQYVVLHTSKEISKSDTKQYASDGWRIFKNAQNNTIVPDFSEVCVNFSNDDNGLYKAYVENETDLPISTFFPTGMKSAGAVYDELTPTRAITRVGAVDLGSLTWGKSSTYPYRFETNGIKDLIKKPTSSSEYSKNLLCDKYEPSSLPITNVSASDKQICCYTTGTIYITDSAYENYTTSQFKTAMSGVMLNYELAVEDVQPTMSFGD